MKKLTLGVICAVLAMSFTACVKDNDTSEAKIDVKNLCPFKEAVLPVKEGQITSAYVDDTTLIAEGDEAMTFFVPKGNNNYL